jgi:hypothetical protein
MALRMHERADYHSRKSLQEYLQAELKRIAAQPSIEAWLRQVRRRKMAAQTRVSADDILKVLDADRR